MKGGDAFACALNNSTIEKKGENCIRENTGDRTANFEESPLAKNARGLFGFSIDWEVGYEP